MEFTGSYYQCNDCGHIIDYSDSHCPKCGSQDETELNAKEVNIIANLLMIVRDFTKNVEGRKIRKMLASHDDLK